MNRLSSYIGYTIISVFAIHVLGFFFFACMESIDYVVLACMYLGLLALVGAIAWNFRKASQGLLSASSFFALFGQLVGVVILYLIFVSDYQSPQDKVFNQKLAVVKNSEADPLVRIQSCEKIYTENKDKNSLFVTNIDEACTKMLVEISRQSYLNVVPALESTYRLENQHNKGESFLTSLKVCLMAESGQLDRAIRMANGYGLGSTVESLRQTRHCNIFQTRNIASEK